MIVPKSVYDNDLYRGQEFSSFPFPLSAGFNSLSIFSRASKSGLKRRPHILKIDAEGHDYQVLRKTRKSSKFLGCLCDH